MRTQLYKLVDACLKDYPETRNDDKLLYRKVIETAENIIIIDTIPLSLVEKYCNASVIRCRAKIQNFEHRYEATDRVRMQRAKYREKWSAWSLVKSLLPF